MVRRRSGLVRPDVALDARTNAPEVMLEYFDRFWRQTPRVWALQPSIFAVAWPVLAWLAAEPLS